MSNFEQTVAQLSATLNMRPKEGAKLHHSPPPLFRGFCSVFGLTARQSSMSPTERPAQDSGWKTMAGVLFYVARLRASFKSLDLRT
jgi:hypothetical protein